jgi:hypothetical protein
VASSRRKFWKSLGSLSLRSFNKFSWVYPFLFFNHSFIHLRCFSFFKHTASAMAKQLASVSLSMLAIGLQLSYCTKILHHLGTPSNIIVQYIAQ